MVGDPDGRQAPREEPEVFRQPVQRQHPVRVVPVDAEVAGVRTAHAGQQRNRCREEGALPTKEGGGPYLGHPLLDAGNLLEGLRGRYDRAGIEPPLKDIADKGLVALHDDEIEEPQAVTRVRSGMGPPDHSQCRVPSIQPGQGAGQRAGLRCRRDEQDVQVLGKLLSGIPDAVIGGVERLVAELPAPDRDRLRSDAGVLLHEEPVVESFAPALRRRRENVEDPDSHVPPPRRAGVSR